MATGYQSDTSKPFRPPRAKARPNRNSISHFSELDTPAEVLSNRTHVEQDIRGTPIPSQSQYQSRRRSRSVFLPQTLPEPPSAQQEPTPPPKPSPPKSKQYTYDDRQSHGYVYSELSDSELIPLPPRMGRRNPTPPMTPDDTLSDSSMSAPEKSGSGTPRSLFRDLARVGSNPVVVEEEDDRHISDEHLSDSVRPFDTHNAGIPTVLRRDSPVESQKRPSAPLGVMLSLTRAHSFTSANHDTEFHPPDGLMTMDDSEVQNGGWRSRRTSLVRWASRGRRHSTPELLTRELFLQGPYSPISPVVPPMPERQNRGSSTAVNVQPLLSADGTQTTRLIAPRAQKSLSHVNLGLRGLPNGSLGMPPTPVANPSMASTDYIHEQAVLPPSHVATDPTVTGPARLAVPRKTIPADILDSPLPALPPPETYEETPAITEPSLDPESDEDLAAYAAYTRFIQSLSPITSQAEAEAQSDASSVNSAQFPILSHESASPEATSAPRIPSPDRSLSPVPVRSESPVRYVNTLKQLTESPASGPQPLPFAPPSPIEAPTPLPQPTPAHIHGLSTPSFLEVATSSPLPPLPHSKTPPPLPHSKSYDHQRVVIDRATSPDDVRLRKRDSPEKDRDAATTMTYLPVAQLRPQVQVQMQAHVQVHAIPQSRAAEDPGPVVQTTGMGHLQHPAQVRAQTAPAAPPVGPYPPVQTRAQTAPPVSFVVEQYPLRARVPTPPAEPRVHVESPVLPPPPPPSTHSYPHAPSHNQAETISQPYDHNHDHDYHSAPSLGIQHQHQLPQAPTAVPAVVLREQARAASPPVSEPRDQYSTHGQRAHGQTFARLEQAQAPHFLRAQSPPFQPPYRTHTPPPQQLQARTQSPDPASSTEHISQTQSVSHEPLPKTGGTAKSVNSAPQTPPEAHLAHSQSYEHSYQPESTASLPNPRPNTPATVFTTFSQPHLHDYPPRRTQAASSQTRSVQHHNSHPHSGRSNPRPPQQRRQSGSSMKFDEHAELTREQLSRAATLFVIAQNGLRIPFGDLFRERKTVVLFIRHFW